MANRATVMAKLASWQLVGMWKTTILGILRGALCRFLVHLSEKHNLEGHSITRLGNF